MGRWPLAPDKQGWTVFQRGPSAPATAAPSLPVSWSRQGSVGTRAAGRQTDTGWGRNGPGQEAASRSREAAFPPCIPLGRPPLGSDWEQVAQDHPPPPRPPGPHPEMKTPPRQRAVIRSAHEPLIHYEPRGRGN